MATPTSVRSSAGRSPRTFTIGFRGQVIGLFLVLAAIYGLSTGGHMYSVDDEVRFQTTRSLVHLDPSIDLDIPEFSQLYRERPDGGYATVYGLGQSVVSVPFYLAGRALMSLSSDRGADVLLRSVTLQTNAVVGALVAALVVLMARELGASKRGAMLLGFVYGLGTYAFPITKTFGGEPATAACITLACFLAFRARRRTNVRLLFWAGLAASLAGSVRVTSLAFLPLIGLYVLVSARGSGRRETVRDVGLFAAGSAVGGLLLVASNWWRYGRPFDIGYGSVDTSYPVLRGVVNLFFSPGKSIFLYAPVVAVAVVGAVVGWRRLRPEHWLLIAIVAVNTYTVSRLAVWSGDHAWGPRYLQIVLPCMVALAATVVDRPPWRRAVRATGVIGFVVAGLLGVLVNFDVFFIQAESALGAGPVASEQNQPAYDVAIHHDIAWNPILAHIELLPRAIRDVAGELRSDEPQRGDYVADPYVRYGFFGAQPRIDVWWLWVGPADGSALTYLLLIPIAVSGGAGVRLLCRSRGPARGEVRPADDEPAACDAGDV